MKKLIECFPTFTKIIEEKKDEKGEIKSLKCEVLWQRSDVINANNRLYPRKILEREINSLKEKIKAGEVWGSAFHPEGDAKVSETSHIWRDIWMEKSGECKGLIEILPTSSGRDSMVLVQVGKVGISSRGTGSVAKKAMKQEGADDIQYEEVQEDFNLISPGDFVLSPSVSDAGVIRIVEQIEKREEKAELDEEKKIKSDYLFSVMAGFSGSFAEFKSKYQSGL